MEKKGTLRQKRRPKGDPNPQKGPLGDPGPLKGTQLGTVQVGYKDVPLPLKVQLCAFCRVGTS